MTQPTRKLGVLINPIAGLGGRVGLKGSDGPQVVDQALSLGAVAESPQRTGYALAQLLDMKDQIQILTYGGAMGEETLQEMGFQFQVVGQPETARTSPQDTITAARLLKEAGVDLILFAGGDGTARNIAEAIGDSVPVIGIPAGVKIHSAVYATNAKNAGLAARDFLTGSVTEVHVAEVMDIDEELFRQGRLSAKLYGYMNVPESGAYLQHTKSSASSERDELMGVVGHILNKIEKEVLYIVGPGSTTKAILDEMNLEGTLLGVDVVKNGQLIAADVTEFQLWELMQDPEQRVKIIVTIIGGQGNLFGRGNQQISPRIIRRVGKKNILIAATGAKLTALYGEPLLVDTGDLELDKELCGYMEVIKGFNHTAIYPVSD